MKKKQKKLQPTIMFRPTSGWDKEEVAVWEEACRINSEEGITPFHLSVSRERSIPPDAMEQGIRGCCCLSFCLPCVFFDKLYTCIKRPVERHDQFMLTNTYAKLNIALPEEGL